MNERDHADLALLTHRVADGELATLSLTEAELGVVTQPDMDDQRFVRLPDLERLSAAERTSALNQAGRALAGRGLLGRDPEATSLLAGLLTMRGYPMMVASAGRTDRGAVTITHRHLYGRVLPGGLEAVLEEAVDADRVHQFTLCSRTDAGARLTQFVDPRNQAREDGPLLTHRPIPDLPPGWDLVEVALAEAETVTQLFSTRRQRPLTNASPAGTEPTNPVRERLTLRLNMVSGPSGVMLVTGHAPVRDGQVLAEDGVLAAQQLGPASLRAALTDFLQFPPHLTGRSN